MPHIAISMYPGRSREEKAALAEKVRTLVSEELKKISSSTVMGTPPTASLK